MHYFHRFLWALLLVVGTPGLIVGQEIEVTVGGRKLVAKPVPGMVSVSHVNLENADGDTASIADEIREKLDGVPILAVETEGPDNSRIAEFVVKIPKSVMEPALEDSGAAALMLREAVSGAVASDEDPLNQPPVGRSHRFFTLSEDGPPVRFLPSFSVTVRQGMSNQNIDETAERLAANHGLVIKAVAAHLILLSLRDDLVNSTTDEQLAALADQIQGMYPEVESAELNFAVLVPQESDVSAAPASVLLQPSDWYRGENGMRIDAALQFVTDHHGDDRRPIRVAVLDNGVDFSLPDLNLINGGNPAVSFDAVGLIRSGLGWDGRGSFENTVFRVGQDPNDAHGSKVAFVVNSVAPSATLISVRGLPNILFSNPGAEGGLGEFQHRLIYEDSVLAGFAWLLNGLQQDQRPHIINASIGYAITTIDLSNAFREVLAECERQKILVVAAAGNDADKSDFIGPLQAVRTVITVGASGPSGFAMKRGGLTSSVYGNGELEIRTYTQGKRTTDEAGNYRGDVDITAFSSPGTQIDPAYRDKWRIHVGQMDSRGFGRTSAATPFVTGAIALAMSLDTGGKLTSDDFRCFVERTASKPFGGNFWEATADGRFGRSAQTAGSDRRWGYGVLNVEMLVRHTSEMLIEDNPAVAGCGVPDHTITINSRIANDASLIAVSSISDRTQEETRTDSPASPEAPANEESKDTPLENVLKDSELTFPIKIDGRLFQLKSEKGFAWIAVSSEAFRKDRDLQKWRHALQIQSKPENLGDTLFFKVSMQELSGIPIPNSASVIPVRNTEQLAQAPVTSAIDASVIKFSCRKGIEDWEKSVAEAAEKHKYLLERHQTDAGVDWVLRYHGPTHPTDDQYIQLYKAVNSRDVLTFQPGYQGNNFDSTLSD